MDGGVENISEMFKVALKQDRNYRPRQTENRLIKTGPPFNKEKVERRA